MPRSRSELYVHFVWTTYLGEPMITPQLEPAVYRIILSEVNRRGAETCAIGGTPDHVHLVIKNPPTLSESPIMQRVKGVSSTLLRQSTHPFGGTFRLQSSYGVFSFHRNQLARVVEYVENQKRHHAESTVAAAWEKTEEDDPATTEHSR